MDEQGPAFEVAHGTAFTGVDLHFALHTAALPPGGADDLQAVVDRWARDGFDRAFGRGVFHDSGARVVAEADGTLRWHVDGGSADSDVAVAALTERIQAWSQRHSVVVYKLKIGFDDDRDAALFSRAAPHGSGEEEAWRSLLGQWVPVETLPVADPAAAAMRPRGLPVPVGDPRLTAESTGVNSDGTATWTYMVPLQNEGPDAVLAALEAHATGAGYAVERATIQPPAGQALRVASTEHALLAVVNGSGPFTMLVLTTARRG